MLKAILIDDEKPALLHLERLLQDDGRVRVLGKYTSVKAGLEHLQQESVHAVFLDIEMPEINGLEAAEYIQQIDQDIRIIYITAYSEYALEAFELNALDYLLKPIRPPRLAKTLARMVTNVEPSNKIKAAEQQLELKKLKKLEKPMIRMFKQLALSMEPQSIQFLKWRTMKAKELFVYLLHYRGQWIPKNQILDILWPEYPHEKAVVHLHTSVYQIRKMLKEWGQASKIAFVQESYCLVLDGLTTDDEQFEQSLVEGDINTEQSWEQGNKALALYLGDYLEEYDYWWLKARRNELQQQYLQLMINMAKYELRTDRLRPALQRLEKVQEMDPYSEAICRLVMEVYAQERNYSKLQSYFKDFVQLLEDDLGIGVEKGTREYYEKLMKLKKI